VAAGRDRQGAGRRGPREAVAPAQGKARLQREATPAADTAEAQAGLAQLQSRGAAAAAPVLALQRTAGNAAMRSLLSQRETIPVSRDDGEGGTAVAARPSFSVTIHLPTRDEQVRTIATVGDLYDAYDQLDWELFAGRSEIFPDRDENPHWEAYNTASDDIRANGQAYTRHRDQFGEPVDPMEVRDFRREVVRVTNIANRGHRHYVDGVRRELQAAESSASRAEARARNAIRDAFLMDSDEANQTAAQLWALADQLQQFGFGVTEALADEGTMLRSVSGLIPRAVAVANVVKDWQTAQPQAFGTPLEAMTDLRNVWSVSSAAISIAGSPLGIFTSHIGPMLEAIDGMMGRLQRTMREFNDTMSDYGMDINPMVEPGGADMWNFMVRLMRAGSAGEVAPPRGEAMRYFDRWRERFNRSNRARAERMGESAQAMPTRRTWIFFREPDPATIARWAFENRQFLWVTLYGARNAETAREWSPRGR
jgi:hypothetical protein